MPDANWKNIFNSMQNSDDNDSSQPTLAQLQNKKQMLLANPRPDTAQLVALQKQIDSMSPSDDSSSKAQPASDEQQPTYNVNQPTNGPYSPEGLKPGSPEFEKTLKNLMSQ